MGIREWFGSRTKGGINGQFGSFNSIGSSVFTYSDNFELNMTRIMKQSPADLYESQPELRTVIDFLAENVAQTGLHVYKHDGNGGKERLRDSPLANVLRTPNDHKTTYEFIYALMADLALWDSAYVYVERTNDPNRPVKLHNILCTWIQRTMGGDAWAPEVYVIQPPNMPDTVEIAAKDMIAWHGWNPKSHRHGASKVETLKMILSEQIHAYALREQIWRKGGRMGGFISRPVGAPEWSQETERKFMRNWNRMNSFDSSNAGEDRLFQDGMTYQHTRFNAHEEEFIEAAKLARTTVAAVYHVNPTMVGVLDNANYSNTREFRKMLYGETLGPLFKQLTQKLNSQLLSMMNINDGSFLEFNVKEKLQGSLEEQAAALSSAGGGPWMTVNEIRATQNLPALPGHDELIVPMNVTVGGQASPQDSAPPKSLTTYASKTALPPVDAHELAEEALTAFFKRQASSVLGKIGSGKKSWWDAERWNNELAEDLSAIALKVSQNGSCGSPDAYDAHMHAFQINVATQLRISKALASGKSPSVALDDAQNALMSLAASDLVNAVTGT